MYCTECKNRDLLQTNIYDIFHIRFHFVQLEYTTNKHVIIDI